jgi:hypothetical protein
MRRRRRIVAVTAVAVILTGDDELDVIRGCELRRLEARQRERRRVNAAGGKHFIHCSLAARLRPTFSLCLGWRRRDGRKRVRAQAQLAKVSPHPHLRNPPPLTTPRLCPPPVFIQPFSTAMLHDGCPKYTANASKTWSGPGKVGFDDQKSEPLELDSLEVLTHTSRALFPREGRERKMPKAKAGDDQVMGDAGKAGRRAARRDESKPYTAAVSLSIILSRICASKALDLAPPEQGSQSLPPQTRANLP